MTWNDVTVFQWQQLNELYANAEGLTDMDISVKAAAILTNQTEHEIDSLPISHLKPLLASISFVHEEIQPKAVKWLKINGNRYRCLYDIRQMPVARYIESKHFSSDVNGNLHRIMACMIMPQKRGWLGWNDKKYNAAEHSTYSEDMLSAPITAVLGSVVFFYQVYRVWIKISKDYLIADMMKKGVTRYQAEAAHQALCSILDGFIKPHWLPNMKESHYKRLMN